MVIGYITHGSIKVSQQCTVYPLKQDFIVQEIKNFAGESVESATIGECIGICTNIKMEYNKHDIPKFISSQFLAKVCYVLPYILYC